MLTKQDRQKNKSKIYVNFSVEYLREGEEDPRNGFVNAESEEHARELFMQILDHQGTKAEILSIKEEEEY